MAGKRAFGAIVAYCTTLAGTYVPIVNVTNIKPFNQKADHMDTTAHDSSGAYREKVVTLLDAGQLDIEYNFDDKAASHLYLANNLGLSLYWKVTFPGGTPTICSFQGYIVGNSPAVPYDNKMTGSTQIEITGGITIA